jgi:hypothetical protein
MVVYFYDILLDVLSLALCDGLSVCVLVNVRECVRMCLRAYM